MTTDRAEELLLLLVAACLLSFLLPQSLARDLVAMVLIALSLVAVLFLRTVSWHRQRATPFDGVLALGVLLSIAHLASFGAFQRGVLAGLITMLFAIFYALMAYLLYEHRWLFRAKPQKPARSDGARVREIHMEPIHEIRLPRPGKLHGSEFKRGLEPLHDVTPEHLHRLGVYDARK
jgi:hypothetical protein